MLSWKTFETSGKPRTPSAWNCCSWNCFFSSFCFLSHLLSTSKCPGTRAAGRGTAPARLALSTSPCAWGKHPWKCVELCVRQWNRLLFVPELGIALCFSWGRGTGASWFACLVRQGSAVTCLQSHLQTGPITGEQKCVFFNPKQIYSLVSCQIFAFSFSAPPSFWHTFFYFLCGSLLVLPPAPLSFVILPKLLWFGGQGVFYSLSFLYFFNSCRAQITSPRLLERHCQLHGGDVGSAACSSCSEPAVTHEHPR